MSKELQDLVRRKNGFKIQAQMLGKIIFWISFWAVSWSVAILSNLPVWIKVFSGCLHLISHLFIAINIAHDANHNAITSNPIAASLLRRSFDLIGISSYCWRQNHNIEHHKFTSIRGYDSTADGKFIMRFTNDAPLYFFHRYQHLYAPFIYSLVTLNYVFIRDYVDFLRYLKNDFSPNLVKEFVISLFFKFFYLTYTIILPCVLYPKQWPLIFSVFIFTHMLLGQIIILIQVPHFNVKTKSVALDEISSDWNQNLNFILKHTADMATTSSFWNWILGGINHHAIHHVSPWICHTEYPNLTAKLESFSNAEGLGYQCFSTIKESYRSHYQYLKIMGKSQS